MKTRIVMAFCAAAMCLALAACEDNGPVTNDSEFEMALANDGSLVTRQRCRDLRAKTNDVVRMQKTIEFLIDKYEPTVFNPAVDTNNPRKIIMRRELIMRGDTLDSYEELKYLDGFATDGFDGLVSNGFVYVPLATNAETTTTHNGNPVTIPEATNDPMMVVRWPTNAPSIWFRQELKPCQGVPICTLYQAYLQANHTFPWKTNDAPVETKK